MDLRNENGQPELKTITRDLISTVMDPHNGNAHVLEFTTMVQNLKWSVMDLQNGMLRWVVNERATSSGLAKRIKSAADRFSLLFRLFICPTSFPSSRILVVCLCIIATLGCWVLSSAGVANAVPTSNTHRNHPPYPPAPPNAPSSNFSAHAHAPSAASSYNYQTGQPFNAWQTNNPFPSSYAPSSPRSAPAAQR